MLGNKLEFVSTGDQASPTVGKKKLGKQGPNKDFGGTKLQADLTQKTPATLTEKYKGKPSGEHTHTGPKTFSASFTPWLAHYYRKN